MAEEKQNQQATQVEAAPVEGPGTELGQVLSEGDPDLQVALLERRAALASRTARAIQSILVTQTYPEDWKQFGDTVCLSSAGAERVSRHFGIRFSDVKWQKEEFTDAAGKGYRYIFEGNATMGDRVVYVQSVYGTRDEFLGRKDKQWKPLEDINENDIRTAAYHIFIGNGVKTLLGLRGMSKTRYDEIFTGAGQSPNAKKVEFGSGTQGGTVEDDRPKQKELAELCIAIAESGQEALKGADGKWGLFPLDGDDSRQTMDLAKDICVAISSFTGKDQKTVAGLPASQLKGKRLEVTLSTARNLTKGLTQQEGGGQ